MRNNYKEFPPIMEGLLDFDLEIKLSLDFGSEAVPNGTINFFDRYGYLVIDDLFKFDGKNHKEGFDLIEKVLSEKIKLKVKKDNFFEYLFTSKNTSLPKNKSDLSAIYQHNTNLDAVSIYIKAKNGDKHRVPLKSGRIIVISKDITCSYCESLSQKIKNKFKTTYYYFHQVAFNYKLT